MKITNLYSGYEGEPEMIISMEQKDIVTHELHIWDGHFSFIVECIKVDEEGFHGLACPYHSGCLDEKFEVTNLSECIDFLIDADVSSKDEETLNVYNVLLSFLQDALVSNSKIVIETI